MEVVGIPSDSTLPDSSTGFLLLLFLAMSLSAVYGQDADIISRNDPPEIIQKTFVSLRRNHCFWTNPDREPVDSYRQQTPQPVLYIDGTSGLYNPVNAHLGMPIVLNDRIDNWPTDLAQHFLLDMALQYSGVRYRLSDTNIADSHPEFDRDAEQSVIAISPTFAISAYAPLQLPLVTQIGVAIHDLQIDGVFDEDRLSQLGTDGEYGSVQVFNFAEADTRYVTTRSLLLTPFAQAEIDSIYTDLLFKFLEGWAVSLAIPLGCGISYWGGGDITGRVGVGWNTIRNEFGRSSRGLDIRFGFLLYR